MAEYPGSEHEPRFAYRALVDAVTAIFMGCGMAAADARLLADSLAQADLRGIHSHGVMRVPDYVDKLTVGGVDPRGRPSVVRERLGAVVVDAGNAMGQIAAAFAMGLAVERARKTGIAMVAVGGSNHCGAMDYWVRLAVEAGMIGIAATNALPTMAPWGGTSKIVGLNPVGIGIPAGDLPPFVLDVALGATAHGKMRIYKQKGQPIPEGWAQDGEGRPTTDPAVGLAGAMLPAGGQKGANIALLVEILAVALPAATLSPLAGAISTNEGGPPELGQFLLALDPAAFGGAETLARIAALAESYGEAGLRLPGARRAAARRKAAAEGVELDEATVATLHRLVGEPT